MDDRRNSKWLWLVFAIPPIAAIITSVLAPDPHGHWTEHITSVGLKSVQLVLLVVLLTMLGWKKLGVLLWISCAIIAFGIVNQVIGDYQVAHLIWRTTDDPGFGVGYADGHDMSGFGDLLVLLGGFAFAVVGGITRRVRARYAVIAVVMVIIPPPFFWPAAGVLMLVVHSLTSSPRFERTTRVAV